MFSFLKKLSLQFSNFISLLITYVQFDSVDKTTYTIKISSLITFELYFLHPVLGGHPVLCGRL